jgi:arginine utilization protein RocB
MRESMLSKLKLFSESVRSSIGLVSLIVIIFITFFVLNIFYGPDKNDELKIAEQKKVQEKANELIETLPRGVLTFYKSDKGRMLSSDEYKIICNNTKIITQRAIMGANITDNKAFNLYTANGGTTGKYFVKWDENIKKCYAEFTIKPLEGSTNSVTVKGEALGFLKTSIDTRVYFIKNF